MISDLCLQYSRHSFTLTLLECVLDFLHACL
uniref:Uncharacterized protein n=1 Tax=Anguilla anguilla TaxID=7936 RepID=A0A0E9VQ95_ANGAN